MRLILFLLSISLYTFSVKTHGVEPTPESMSQEQLARFIDETHQSMEMENPNSTLIQKWGKNFNLVNLAVNSLRWIEINKTDSQAKEHVHNLIFLLGASHLVEVLSGPIGLTIGHEMNLGMDKMALIGTVGAVVSIPGLDPLCLFLASLYKTRQGFRKTVTSLRVLSTHQVQKISKKFLSVQQFLPIFKISANEKIQDWIQKNRLNTSNSSVENRIEIQSKNQTTFIFEVTENQIHLIEIIIPRRFSLDEAKELLLSLPATWAGKKTIEYLFSQFNKTNPESYPYFVKNKSTSSGFQIELLPGSVTLKSSRVIRKSSCTPLFK